MRRVAPLVLCLVACGARVEPKEPSATEPREAMREGATCAGLGALVDLHGELATVPTPVHAPLAPIADVQADLAAARAALAATKDDPTLHSSIERLAALLEGRRVRLATATQWANESHAAAVAALHDASTCRGVDLVSLSKKKEKTERNEEHAIARSKACEGTLRLWAMTDGLDLASALSTARVASQLGDLRTVNAAARDRLKVALERHAKNLQALDETAKTAALDDARKEVEEGIGEAYRTCLARPDPKAAPNAVPADPREATVMVRPAWSGSLKRLPSAAALRFGSGFLVRWREGTFVVTNRHVMEGAVEAEILFAGDVENAKRDRKSTRIATLVAADASDDVAVLRIDGKSLPSLSFRLEPAHEQETVVAAGFPGMGAMPSFQVTRGVVSNAHFASDADAAGIAYVQHTAAIDPGNSGGPLLDERGRLVGMNTAKMTGRESVSFAIPAARLRFALSRTERPRRFEALHAEAACNVALDALASEHPTITSVRLWAVALYDGTTHRARVDLRALADSPIDEARVRAFEGAREAIDAEGGVAPFATCTEVAPRNEGGFVANVRTRSGSLFRVALDAETDELRVVSFAQLRGGT